MVITGMTIVTAGDGTVATGGMINTTGDGMATAGGMINTIGGTATSGDDNMLILLI
ncbi:MAG: hypothetical protein GX152_10600 [Methanosarcina sp.]|nr:hypothetical protein [Methanosarcina sp.]